MDTDVFLGAFARYRNQVLGDALYTVPKFGGFAALSRYCQPMNQGA